jgi:predicted nuclease of predicted toxin-antitoxin system
MAKLYTNENFPLPAAQELRRLGHDVMTVQESGLGGQAVTDESVMRFAIRERRAVVTLNRRHFVRLHEENPGHAGIIVCTADKDFLALAARIDASIRRDNCLDGRLARVNRAS